MKLFPILKLYKKIKKGVNRFYFSIVKKIFNESRRIQPQRSLLGLPLESEKKTVGIWNPDMFGHQMVNLCRVFGWSVIGMVHLPNLFLNINSLFFEWSGPFEIPPNRAIWNPTFKNSAFWMFADFEWLDFRSPLLNNLEKKIKLPKIW